MKEFVVSLVRFLTQYGYTYSTDANSPGNLACVEAWQAHLMTEDALQLVYHHMFELQELSGCCLHWSLCLIHLLRQRGYSSCGLVMSPEFGGKKVSVYYTCGDQLFIADIVEYIKGAVKSIDDIAHIPYDEFAKPFGADAVWLIDLSRVTIPLMNFLYFDAKPNTTPDEILKKE